MFDGDCIFCSAFARFMSRFDRAGRFRFVVAQSATGRALYVAHGLDPDALQTNIVIADGVAHVKMDAFAAAMRAIGWPWRVLAVARFLPFADWIYDRIAANRYVFGKRACPLPSAALRNRLIG